LLKHWLPASVHSLLDIRQTTTRAFAIKETLSAEAVARQFRFDHFLKSEYGLNVSRTVCQWVDRLIGDSKPWIIERTEEFKYHAKNAVHEDSEWDIVVEDFPTCECMETSATGLPCPHLIALYKKFSDRFPIALIDKRWIQSEEVYVAPELPDLAPWEADDMARIASEMSSDNDESDSDDIGILIPPIREDQTRRYHRIMNLCRQLAQKASQAQVPCDKICVELGNLLDSLTTEVDGEIRDVMGKPRGRPRKKGYSARHHEKSTCPLCRKNHRIQLCSFYPVFEEVRKNHDGRTDGRLCSICGFTLHNKATCPVLDKTLKRIAKNGRTGRKGK
jgi:hypothetical protein